MDLTTNPERLKMKIAVLAGSFDPFTNGHLDIVKQALNIFDKIVIACGDNPEKTYMIPLESRIKLIETCLYQELEYSSQQIKVEAFPKQLLVDYCQQHNYQFVIRGIRNVIDFEYEKELLNVNRDLSDSIQYAYFLPDASYMHISSTLVKGLLQSITDDILLKKYVPATIANYLIKTIYD